LVGTENRAEIRGPDGVTMLGSREGKPLDVLATILGERPAPTLPGWPPMTGGLVGVLGYDLVRTWEHLPRRPVRDLALPLYVLMETSELFVFDHVEEKLGIIAWTDVTERATPAELAAHFEAAQRATRHAAERWSSASETEPPCAPEFDEGRDVPDDTFSSEEFQAAVRRAQDFIAAGHTYQVNLSMRTSRRAPIDAATVYAALRRVNPSPYMGLLRFPELALVCGSPELLVRLVEGVVSSRPIAGTRPRGDVAAHDAHLSTELTLNEKERAEHLMLVDLIRNDIGRVAEFGSVHVREFMAIERYSHVMHLVSEVQGKLAANRTWRDVLRAMSPGGTITGCPKIRTMEIIDELEPVGRGFYTGSLGWISYAGDMEMNIVIRSLLLQDGIAHVQAGAGIVADSLPAREFDEACRKARALWVALEQALAETREKEKEPA
jgi:para-aminobenzoate synthetase component 1